MQGGEWAGLAGTVLAGIAALVAAFSKRRTDRDDAEERARQKIADERTALTGEWRALLDPYRAEVGTLRGKLEQVEDRARRAEEANEQCESNMTKIRERLAVAEARIAELGG